jgi:hypothetical protein
VYEIFCNLVMGLTVEASEAFVQHAFCVMRGDVQTWSFVLLLNFSNKLKLCAPKPARTQSPNPLQASLTDDTTTTRQTTINIK